MTSFAASNKRNKFLSITPDNITLNKKWLGFRIFRVCVPTWGEEVIIEALG